MAKGYWINCFRAVKDQAKVDAYRKLAAPVMQAAGARFLVRGDPVKTYEAGLMMRTVVIEFDSVAGAIAAHDSPGYQAALSRLRHPRRPQAPGEPGVQDMVAGTGRTPLSAGRAS